MFVVEMLAPQIQVTVAALTERIPTFIEQTSAKLMQLMDDNPDMKAWIMDIANLESLEWTKILKDSMGFLGNQMSTVMGSAVNVIGSVTSGIVNLVVSIHVQSVDQLKAIKLIKGKITDLDRMKIEEVRPDRALCKAV